MHPSLAHAAVVVGITLTLIPPDAGAQCGERRGSTPAGSSSLASALFKPVTDAGAGGALLVVQRDTVRLQQTFGEASRETHAPVTSGTAFDIASIAKQFTALTLLQLAESGRVALDDSLRHYFPTLPAWAATIRLRHLLGHTSGIPDYEALWERSGRLRGDGSKPGGYEPGVPETIDLLTTVRAPDFPVGSRWAYSNTNYVLLARIVEIVTGESFAARVMNVVFAPLQMRGSAIGYSHGGPCRASSYTLKGKTMRNVDYHALNGMYGDGALFTTLDDMARWMHELEHPTLLGVHGRDLWWSAQHLDDGVTTGYGGGWFIGPRAGLSARWHSGYWNGFKSSLVWYPDQHLLIFAVANLEQFDPDIVTSRIAAHWLAPELSSRVITIPATQLELLAGHYVLNTKLAFDVNVRGDTLYLRGTGQAALALVAVGPLEFYAVDHPEIGMTFERGLDGVVRTLIVHQLGDHLARRDR